MFEHAEFLEQLVARRRLAAQGEQAAKEPLQAFEPHRVFLLRARRATRQHEQFAFFLEQLDRDALAHALPRLREKTLFELREAALGRAH